MGDQHSLANKVAFAFVAGSAGVQALQQALKDAPELVATTRIPDMNVGGWNYVPLILVTLGVLVWVLERAFKAGYSTQTNASAEAVGRVLEAVSAPPATDPLPKPTPPREVEGRTFLPSDVTYADLVGRLVGKTDLQKDALTAPFRGKWMRSVGVFDDVTSSMDGGVLVFIRLEKAGNVACAFKAEWKEQVSAINVGDIVTFDGRLDSLTRGAKFKDCEIVDVRPPPPKASTPPKAPRPRKKAGPKS